MTDSPFPIRPVPPAQVSGEEAFPDTYDVKILFDKNVRFRLIEEYGLNCYEETKSGLLLSMGYTNRDYMMSWLLGFGDKAEVLEPQELREELAAIAKNISKLYNRT